jgi:hypothetical protein
MFVFQCVDLFYVGVFLPLIFWWVSMVVQVILSCCLFCFSTIIVTQILVCPGQMDLVAFLFIVFFFSYAIGA